MLGSRLDPEPGFPPGPPDVSGEAVGRDATASRDLRQPCRRRAGESGGWTSWSLHVTRFPS